MSRGRVTALFLKKILDEHLSHNIVILLVLYILDMAPKRKTGGGSSSPAKKGKQQKSEDKNTFLANDEVSKMISTIISESSYNHLVPLLNQYQHIQKGLITKEDEELESNGRHLTVSLFKVFQHLFKEGLLVNKKSYDEKKSILVKWLINKYSGYKEWLCEFIRVELAYKTSLQLDMLDIYFRLIKVESEYLKASTTDLYFPNVSYKNLIEALLLSEHGDSKDADSNDNFLVLEFNEKFVKYYDLQFYFFYGLHELVERFKSNYSNDSSRLRTIFNNYYTIINNKLLYINDFEELKDRKTFTKLVPSIAYKLSQFKSQYQKALLSILSYPLTNSQFKSILLILHKRILPYMSQSTSLMDFLTDTYNIKSDLIFPILALNSLYELMKKHNLEYPGFYTKLYSLLTPDLLYSRHRSRFFRLCDLFLSSTHLSSALVASFIKKLARLSITSSTSGVVIVIPFIYNLLKRHPTCMIMIHRPDYDKSNEFQDPFNVEESNPLKTEAINSSLWELEALMNHYHPNVATLAQIFKEPFKKPHYNLEDFLDWTYESLLQSEKHRKYKSMASLEYEEFDSLFETNNSVQPFLHGWSL